MHSEWLAAYGIDPAKFSSTSRMTLPVSEQLEALVKSDGLALDEVRAPERRSAGTCRDFALTLCSFLRSTGTPARPRCGFAAYLADGWEDHWICEYWEKCKAAWRLCDPQLDEVTRATCNAAFDPFDMPREDFLTAGEAWLRCRAGKDDPERFGHGDARGLWFMKVNVVRDSYVLSGHETSAWDRWREALPAARTVAEEDLPLFDGLARHPEAAAGNPRPEWLER